MNEKTTALQIPENPYLLLTPGPLSTSAGVRAAMLRDWCTWDDDYKEIVEEIRRRLTALATAEAGYTSVLMQGSGTFVVEATLTTALPADGRLLVLDNGAYGRRLAEIARRQQITLEVLEFAETEAVQPALVADLLARDPRITHVAMVHCETTTGMLNPATEVGRIVKEAGRIFILDAMSSFAGLALEVADCGADFLISSANKCIQGVPGFGFVIARRDELEQCRERARSLSLDLYDQWRVMEADRGKWRFTSPTHTVRAFLQALRELEEEGGISARARRYRENQRLLVDGMRELGFLPLLPPQLQSPIITAFFSPADPDYDFTTFYNRLKEKGFVIYPGKVSRLETFRIGNIGQVFAADIKALLAAVGEVFKKE